MNELYVLFIENVGGALLLAVGVGAYFIQRYIGAWAANKKAEADSMVNAEFRQDMLEILAGSLVQLGNNREAVQRALDTIQLRYPAFPADEIESYIYASLPDVIHWAGQAKQSLPRELGGEGILNDTGADSESTRDTHTRAARR